MTMNDESFVYFSVVKISISFEKSWHDLEDTLETVPVLFKCLIHFRPLIFKSFIIFVFQWRINSSAQVIYHLLFNCDRVFHFTMLFFSSIEWYKTLKHLCVQQREQMGFLSWHKCTLYVLLVQLSTVYTPLPSRWP